MMADTIGTDVRARESARLIASDKVEGPPFAAATEKTRHDRENHHHKYTGKVAYAVISFGGFLCIGDEYRALPWNLLDYNERLDAHELNVTEDQLRNAPIITTGWEIGTIDRDWERKIHDYY